MSKVYNPLNHSVVQGLLKADGYQRYECPDYVEALLREVMRELERVYWNWHQEQFEDRKDWQYLKIEGFAHRRYCWDDCDCGVESPVHAKDCKSVTEYWEWNRRRLAAISDPPTKEAIEFAKKIGCYPLVAHEQHFERSPAWVKGNPPPACNCGAEGSWVPRETHAETCSPQLPNMEFSRVRISWYKRLGRGMSVNVDWTPARWVKWFDRLMALIRTYDSCFNHCSDRHQLKDCPRKDEE